MVYREVSMIEVREALRAWLAGKSERAVAVQAGVDRKTGKRYVTAAVAAGLSRGGGEEQLTDELIGQVVSVVRPVRPDGHGQGWGELEARREQIAKWAEGGVPVVKIGILLGRQGVVVAERTLHRFVAERCGGKKVTTPVDDGPPGSELQIDFGDLGLIPAGDGRRRKLRALVFTACFSRYLFVYLTFSMTLEEVIAGCEDAWAFFGGVFAVVVPGNMSPVVAKADAVNPRLTREWLEYAQARGFVTDPARVRHPRDKPRVEAGVHYVQGNFFAGESFLDLADARSKMAAWLGVANARVHGSTRQVPAVVFAAHEAPCLRPPPAGRYQVPYWAQVKVHVDYHLLTELTETFPQVTPHIADRCTMVADRDRGRGCVTGPGRAGGASRGSAGGDRRRVGAVPARRPGRHRGDCGLRVVRGSAGCRPFGGHTALIRHGPAAMVPVPLGGRDRVGPGDPRRRT
jgi:Integrase core domain